MALSDILKISFEFSSKLGVRELPELSSAHESNVSGLYVVGDLADAPIIKIALNQGYEVATRVADELLDSKGVPDILDAVVIGAGPAGIGAALALQKRGLNFTVFEKEQPFNTIQNFPKAKLIFSEPRDIQTKTGLWFQDALKEDLVDHWERALEENALPIRQPEEVLDVQKRDGVFEVRTKVGATATSSRSPDGSYSDEPGSENIVRARKVILAIGRRGSVNRLPIPGEERDNVNYTLRDPDDFKGKRLLVVGGGDSAVEAAMACAESGAEVTIAYRGKQFVRAKAKNRERIQTMIDDGRVKAEFEATPVEVGDGQVTLRRREDAFTLPNDEVLAFLGTRLPAPFLKRIGLRLAGAMTTKRALWVLSFALMTYLFYILKTKRVFFPFGPSHPLGWVPEMLKHDLGFRAVDGSFWGTVVYSALILVFGIKAYRKYPSPSQKRRYVSLMVFQLFFLFGLPELIAPFVIDRPWKLYAITVPWPLSIWSLVDAPGWAGGLTSALVWLGLGFVSAFVLIPLYVRSQGLRFCSYLCGCGGLAETLGDMWRHLAPRGLTSYKSEWAGRVVFLAAVPVTLLILNDAWQFVTSSALKDATVFAQQWYGLMVDFWLASVVGVAFYPYLGNRVWCRFFCPLRAWMEILARRFSKIAIRANDKCIGCGECTRYCQMGITVQKFAQQRAELSNANSSCIQCGVCVEVCPMDVLSVAPRSESAKGLPIMQPATGPRGRS